MHFFAFWTHWKGVRQPQSKTYPCRNTKLPIRLFPGPGGFPTCAWCLPASQPACLPAEWNIVVVSIWVLDTKHSYKNGRTTYTHTRAKLDICVCVWVFVCKMHFFRENKTTCSSFFPGPPLSMAVFGSFFLSKRGVWRRRRSISCSRH